MNHKIKKTFIPFAAIVSACISLVACGPTSNPTSEPTIDPTEPSVEPSTEPVVAKNNNYTNPTYPVVNGKEEPTYMADPFVIRGDDGKFYHNRKVKTINARRFFPNFRQTLFICEYRCCASKIGVLNSSFYK